MTRFEQDYYNDISSIEKSLKRIADALEKGNTTTKQENEELDTHHDYLHQLVKNLSGKDYAEFCNEHCLPTADAVAVSSYITSLDYDGCLSIISDLDTDLSIRYKNKIKEFPKSDDQANEDAIESQNDYPNGVTYDDDYDLRVTARMYTAELEAGDFRTKKDCILDYVTNEFGSQGARYTDIIKFAYYLNNPNSPKFSYHDRGYYSCGISGRNPYLVCGGKDFLVKGINKDNDERYFALSFVESATSYWKYIGGTHGRM